MGNKNFLKKKGSKRLTCRRKHKIEKKIREHHRKVRKETKEKQKKGIFRKKPDIQVPNKCPFKDEVLRQAQEIKQKEEEEKVKRREELKQKRKAEKSKLVDKKRNLESVVAEAEEKQQKFEASSHLNKFGQDCSNFVHSATSSVDNSLKVYYSEVKKVLERADILIQVLDARDPLGSRSQELEKSVIESGKRLVLLLNKIDLIPKDNALAWLKYLRNEYPTVAFKASTQEQTTRLGRAGHAMVATSKCIGADLLMKLLGNYCRNKDIKTSICVGIVGFPNVGKSSVINSLKRKATCSVGARPGITKALQEVHLDKKIRLLDSPGVALCSKESYDQVEMALRNVLRVDLLEDPVLPVQAILRRCTKESLILQYNIPDFDDVDEFLSNIGRKLGRLKKGGVPDRLMAAKKVLHDWNSGKIRYFTLPPETAAGIQVVSTELVTEMCKEFDLEALDNDLKLMVEELPTIKQPDSIVLPAWKDVVKVGQPAKSDTMDVDQTSNSKPSKSILKNVKSMLVDHGDEEMSEDGLEGNLKLNKKLKRKFKHEKKKRKRSDKLATKLSNAFDSAMEITTLTDKTNNYDFDTDFK